MKLIFLLFLFLFYFFSAASLTSNCDAVLQAKETPDSILYKAIKERSTNPVFIIEKDGKKYLFKLLHLKQNNWILNFDYFSGRSMSKKSERLNGNKLIHALDKIMGFNLTSEIHEMSSIILGDGFLQEFFQDYRTARSALRLNSKVLEQISKAEAQKFVLFDLLTGSNDRHLDNWMINSAGKIKMIDNDNVFLRVQYPMWRHFVNVRKTLPQAMGSVDETIAQTFLVLDKKQLHELMDSYGFDQNSIHFALNRLQKIKSGLRSGKSLEEMEDEITKPKLYRLLENFYGSRFWRLAF